MNFSYYFSGVATMLKVMVANYQIEASWRKWKRGSIGAERENKIIGLQVGSNRVDPNNAGTTVESIIETSSSATKVEYPTFFLIIG